MPAIKDEASQFDHADLHTSPRKGVTLRAFVIGLIYALCICAITPYNDLFVGATYLAGNYFPVAGVAAILILVLIVNPLLIALGRRERTFSPSEIITIWAMYVVVAGIPSSGLMRYLIPHIVAPSYFANAQNGWINTVMPYVPHRLIVTDPQAVHAFFEGSRRGQPIRWGAWIGPLGWWALFVIPLYVVFFSLSTLVRRQWVVNERLTFPLAQIPVLLSENPEPGRYLPPLLSNPLFWCAVAGVTILHTIKGLHIFYPSIPDIPLSINTLQLITTPPYTAVNPIVFAIFPIVLGFAYLLPQEVCFSLWFFYVAFKLQVLFSALAGLNLATNGWGGEMGPGFVTYQETGGFVIVAVWIIWSMRAHLSRAWMHALGKDAEYDDADEPLSYRTAFIGLFCGYGALFLWLTLVADVQPLMAFAVLSGSLAIFMVLAWITAQAGLLFVQQCFTGSVVAMSVAPSHTFAPQSLFMGTLSEHIGWYDARELMLPSLLNANRAAEMSSLSPRSLSRALTCVIALALIVSAAVAIRMPSTHGGGTSLQPWTYILAPQIPFQVTTKQLMAHGAGNHGGALSDMFGGGVFTLALILLRSRFAWFPLHPLGFLIAATYPMQSFWFSLFLGWAIKVPIVRFGGMKGYRALLNFFMGLIVGDCLNAVIWVVVGLVTHNGYSLLPG